MRAGASFSGRHPGIPSLSALFPAAPYSPTSSRPQAKPESREPLVPSAGVWREASAWRHPGRGRRPKIRDRGGTVVVAWFRSAPHTPSALRSRVARALARDDERGGRWERKAGALGTNRPRRALRLAGVTAEGAVPRLITLGERLTEPGRFCRFPIAFRDDNRWKSRDIYPFLTRVNHSFTIWRAKIAYRPSGVAFFHPLIPRSCPGWPGLAKGFPRQHRRVGT